MEVVQFTGYHSPLEIRIISAEMIDDAGKNVTNDPQWGSPTKKRKRNTPVKTMADSGNAHDLHAASSPSKKKKATTKKPDEEKRLKRFRSKAPSSYLEKLHRATTQRYVNCTLLDSSRF